MAEAESVADALSKTRQLLETTQQGLAMLQGLEANLRPMGIHNVAVFGRSVTFALQNLRTVVGKDAFDEWYAPHLDEMKDSELLSYFRDLRNEILKEGPPGMTTSVMVEYLNTADLQPLMQNPPPGAAGFFMFDALGGSGWEITMPDGSTQKYYVVLPEEVKAEFRLHLPSPPSTHLGEAISDTSIQALAVTYVEYLAKLVDAADRHFGSS